MLINDPIFSSLWTAISSVFFSDKKAGNNNTDTFPGGFPI